MDDAVLVRGFERLGDLARDRQRLVERERRLRDAIGERRRPRRAPSRAHWLPSALFEAVDLGDVRVVQRGEQLRLALEARQPLGIVRERCRAES